MMYVWLPADYQAEQCLKSSKLLYEAEDLKGAANRAYYCIFHSIRNVIALDGVEFKRHSGNSTYFRKEYIKTGLFDESMSDIITKAFAIRSNRDYDYYRIYLKNYSILCCDWWCDGGSQDCL